jgi:SpoVK/Ycf46/Vps4 family AAA+-type ATPase
MADPVIEALQTALANLPDPNGDDAIALRLHLGSELASRGRLAEALAQAEAVLSVDPASVAGLRMAVRIGEELADSRVAAWTTLLGALEVGSQPPPPDSENEQTSGPSAVLAEGSQQRGTRDEFDEFDEFLMDTIRDDRRNRIRLGDVGGMVAVKAQLDRSFFAPIRNPEMQAAYGLTPGGGLLLYGPPGCGKTFLARAIAGELDANFITLGLHDVLDMWMGNSEKQLHQLFETARDKAPSVLFFDEVDAIGQKRSSHNSSAMRNVVAQLLSEMDGMSGPNDGVYMIGATNAPWDVDPALRRPGRFDRSVAVLPPDAEARAAILEYHLRDRPTERLDLAAIAAKTAGFSGADLRLVCESAVEAAMQQALKTGTVVPIDQKLLVKAARSVKPSVGPWLDTARNYVTFANADGQYDDLAVYLKTRPA